MASKDSKTKSSNQLYLVPKKTNPSPSALAFGSLSIASIISALIFPQHLLAIGLVAAGSLGALSLGKYITSLFQPNNMQQLQELKEDLFRCDQQIKTLEHLIDQKEYISYGILSYQVLPQIRQILEKTNSLKNQMDQDIYHRISQSLSHEQKKIEENLQSLNLSNLADSKDSVVQDILTYAPEITVTYQNIQYDHLEILSKLQNAENKAELRAIHEINMKQFYDILHGYLKIKKAPKNYNQAEARLAKAKAALEQFDTDLDTTLKKLNEAELGDFEISLRMMEKKHYGQEDLF